MISASRLPPSSPCIIAGRYLLNPLFQIIARTGAREVMIAAALLDRPGGRDHDAAGRPVDGDGRLPCRRHAGRILLPA